MCIQCMNRPIICMHAGMYVFTLHCIACTVILLSLKQKPFVGWHQPAKCCRVKWQWGAGALDAWGMWHHLCCQEGKVYWLWLMVRIPVLDASNVHLPLLQSKATDLFAAAHSGNINLFDLLVQRFNLPPDQWKDVSTSYLNVLCTFMMTYLHALIVPMLCFYRIDPRVLSQWQQNEDIVQWWSTSSRNTIVTGERWARFVYTLWACASRGFNLWFVDQFVCLFPPFCVHFRQICCAIAPFVTISLPNFDCADQCCTPHCWLL